MGRLFLKQGSDRIDTEVTEAGTDNDQESNFWDCRCPRRCGCGSRRCSSGLWQDGRRKYKSNHDWAHDWTYWTWWTYWTYCWTSYYWTRRTYCWTMAFSSRSLHADQQ